VKSGAGAFNKRDVLKYIFSPDMQSFAIIQNINYCSDLLAVYNYPV